MSEQDNFDSAQVDLFNESSKKRSRLNPAGLKPVKPEEFHTFMISHAFKFFVAISILLMACVLTYLIFTKDREEVFPSTPKIVFYGNIIGFVGALALALIAGISAAVPKG